MQSSGETRRENGKSWIRHCEERKRRSNPEPLAWLWIASLTLAMTEALVENRTHNSHLVVLAKARTVRL
jgi:hypothetical protein